jgi:hypothetical protein
MENASVGGITDIRDNTINIGAIILVLPLGLILKIKAVTVAKIPNIMT